MDSSLPSVLSLVGLCASWVETKNAAQYKTLPSVQTDKWKNSKRNSGANNMVFFSLPTPIRSPAPSEDLFLQSEVVECFKHIQMCFYAKTLPEILALLSRYIYQL